VGLFGWLLSIEFEVGLSTTFCFLGLPSMELKLGVSTTVGLFGWLLSKDLKLEVFGVPTTMGLLGSFVDCGLLLGFGTLFAWVFFPLLTVFALPLPLPLFLFILVFSVTGLTCCGTTWLALALSLLPGGAAGLPLGLPESGLPPTAGKCLKSAVSASDKHRTKNADRQRSFILLFQQPKQKCCPGHCDQMGTAVDDWFGCS